VILAAPFDITDTALPKKALFRPIIWATGVSAQKSFSTGTLPEGGEL
jgi:hypothetical protein